jgi:formate dehydrogenase maturation protein FdhE
MAAEGLRQRFQRRAARARLLAARPSSGVEPLRFAAGLFDVLGETSDAVLAVHQRQALTGGFELDAPRVLELLLGVYRFLASDGPGPLRVIAAQQLSTRAPMLATMWSGAEDDFAAQLVLRGYAEALVFADVSLQREPRPGACPHCGQPPTLCFRRPAAGTDGAARWLVCGLCATEWQTNRIRCPSCGETDPEQLPSFQADTWPIARVEACDRCHAYVKSIDLSLDGGAVPEVDELISLGLDLWAVEKGYTRLAPGLAGV